MLAAYLPTDQIENIAKIVGVRALTMEHRPGLRVGKVTSQGCAVLGTDVLNNLGLQGDGITVGVLSDSFNTAQYNTSSPPATTADQDVITHDLPVVKVVQELPPFSLLYPGTQRTHGTLDYRPPLLHTESAVETQLVLARFWLRHRTAWAR